MPCSNCNGEGYKNTKNAAQIHLYPNKDDEGDSFSADKVADYISPPVDILQFQIKNLETYKREVEYTTTGMTNLVEMSVQKTATEASMNIKPLEDKISDVILSVIEFVETFLTNTMGRIRYPDMYKGCVIRRGRRLNIWNEQSILAEIEKSKKNGAPMSFINGLYRELIFTRYKNNHIELERNLLLFELEPLPGYTMEEIINNRYINDQTKILKMNFNVFKIFKNDIIYISNRIKFSIISIYNISIHSTSSTTLFFICTIITFFR